MHTYMHMSARGVVDIFIENEHRFQILDEADCISHSTNTIRKDMNPIILLPALGKIGQTGLFRLGVTTEKF